MAVVPPSPPPPKKPRTIDVKLVSVDGKLIGKCSSCGAKGVAVSHPPMSRCIDMKKCDSNRLQNAKPGYALGVKKAVVRVRRRGADYWFRRVELSHPIRNELNQITGYVRGNTYLELVPVRREATAFSASEANELVMKWSGTAEEV